MILRALFFDNSEEFEQKDILGQPPRLTDRGVHCEFTSLPVNNTGNRGLPFMHLILL